ncbi:MAG: tetratricopeptide repeat protein [Bacteroidetes bacterium]|nr:tetratricopeptide repeat protein [Bacteroidota bacterium]
MSRKEQLEELLKEDPRDPFLHYGVALEYAKEGKLKEAIVRLEKLIAENENYLGAYYQLGQFYEKENETEKAKNIYSRGIALAKKQGNRKTEGEMRSALEMLE